MRIRIWMVWGMFLLVHKVLAMPASEPDSLLLNTRATRTGIHTYTLLNNLQGNYQLPRHHKLFYFFQNDLIYNSGLEQNPFVRENYQLAVRHEFPFKTNWKWIQQVQHSQNKANQISISSFTEQLQYSHQLDSLAEVRYTAFAGIRRDSRNLFTDTGPEVGGEVTATLLPYRQGELANGRVQVSRAFLGERIYEQVLGEGFYEKQLNAFSTIGIRAGYYSTTSEDYISGTIQKIKSDTITGQLQWSYQISKAFSFRSDNAVALPSRNFLYRPFETETVNRQNFGYDQMEINSSQELGYAKGKLQTSLQFVFRERDRTYGLQNNLNLSGPQLESAAKREKIKDIRESTTAWIFNGNYLINRTHSISAQTRAQLLRLDTPSNENDQDRDEVHYVGRVQLSSRWSNTFRTTFALTGEAKQFVFIKASQSAENYTDHILSYEPGFTWAPGRFSIRANYQLLATYHVRALQAEQLKNRSNRTLFQLYEFNYDLNRSWSTALLYNRRENRLSLLNWQEFTESPLDTTTSNDFTLFLKKRFKNEVSQTSIRLGYRYFEQRIQNRAGLLQPDQSPKTIFLRNITRQHGPELVVEVLNRKRGLQFFANVWLQQLHSFYRYTGTEIVYLGQTYTPEDLNRQQKNFYPTFELNLSWNFSKQ